MLFAVVVEVVDVAVAVTIKSSKRKGGEARTTERGPMQVKRTQHSVVNAVVAFFFRWCYSVAVVKQWRERERVCVCVCVYVCEGRRQRRAAREKDRGRTRDGGAITELENPFQALFPEAKTGAVARRTDKGWQCLAKSVTPEGSCGGPARHAESPNSNSKYFWLN